MNKGAIETLLQTLIAGNAGKFMERLMGKPSAAPAPIPSEEQEVGPVPRPAMKPHPLDALNDRHLLAKTIYGEAAEQPFKGKLAVGQVIMNRVNTPGKYGQDIRSVVTKPNAFSIWNNLGNPWTHKTLISQEDDPAYAEALKAADMILSGKAPDLTKGATHYYNPKKADPAWKTAGKETARIGDHRFRRGVDK